jgi:hypothetical protein
MLGLERLKNQLNNNSDFEFAVLIDSWTITPPLFKVIEILQSAGIKAISITIIRFHSGFFTQTHCNKI